MAALRLWMATCISCPHLLSMLVAFASCSLECDARLATYRMTRVAAGCGLPCDVQTIGMYVMPASRSSPFTRAYFFSLRPCAATTASPAAPIDCGTHYAYIKRYAPSGDGRVSRDVGRTHVLLGDSPDLGLGRVVRQANSFQDCCRYQVMASGGHTRAAGVTVVHFGRPTVHFTPGTPCCAC